MVLVCATCKVVLCNSERFRWICFTIQPYLHMQVSNLMYEAVETMYERRFG